MIRTGIGPTKVVGEEHENMRLVRSEREGKPRQPDKRRKCYGGCHVCCPLIFFRTLLVSHQ